MFSWCCECIGLSPGPQKVAPLHNPLKAVHTNLRLRREVSSSMHASDDTNSSDSGSENESDDQQQDEYILREGKPYLKHPMAVPTTVIVQVQPNSEHIHRPDLEKALRVTNDYPPVEDSEDSKSTTSSQPESTSVSGTSSNALNSNSTSRTGSTRTIESFKSLQTSPNGARDIHDRASLPDLTDSLGRKLPFVTLEHSRRRPMKFLSPEEAAKTPIQPPSPPLFSFSSASKVKEYPKTQNAQWLRTGLPSIFSEGDNVKNVGEYYTEGNKIPVKLRSENTLKAIAIYGTRIDTKTNPVWYSFGSLVVALRYLIDSKRMEVDILQVTKLPPGKEESTLDFKIRIAPGHRRGWIKDMTPGTRHDSEITGKTILKAEKLTNRSLIVSAWVDTKKYWPHLALGHAVVPDLGSQNLSSGKWQTFPLFLRQGSKTQDHLGMALIALSCCERNSGSYTFTADVLHVKNVKVQRFGDGAVSSSKAKVQLWVKAFQHTEGTKKKMKMPTTELIRPGYDESKGWEAIYKRHCSASFDIPKEKVNLSSITLEIHGIATHQLSTKEALFGKVKLGPEELFSDENHGIDPENSNEKMKSVSNDPLDPKLTHWGQALRRKAKVEMWHRLQI
ncbi:hypothetical protein SK128_020378 [Halocaridina rubra]|uniref:Uncharacterized protein n=1 Tax=Halocaridina rubra TaxID=373956 RepID=A0AAN8WUR3_HALRR